MRSTSAFAVCYAGVAHVAERTSLARLRRAALAEARGTLLVVGAGQGHDLAHLPPAVSSVVALEPDPAMRRLGRHRVSRAPVRAAYVAAVAERLPLADASVDSALVTLVLCSVADPLASARELRRVLRADGVLLVLEHVRGDEGSRTARWQDRVDPLWRHVSGGCHVDRPTRSVLEQAGFDTSRVGDVHLARALPVLDPALLGVATPR